MYQLIAFDMDGTLLNSQKKITKESIEAIKKAARAGKDVILNTGRCYAELADYMDDLASVRYLNCVSGAMVIDTARDTVLYECLLDVETVNKILSIAQEEDTMVHMLKKQSIVQKSKWTVMERYGMGVYKDMFGKAADLWDDLPAQYAASPFPVGKVNIYHRNTEARDRTRERLKQSGLSIQYVDAELTSIEISVKGIDKSVGLRNLCEKMHIPMDQVIVVGDADNDEAALRIAGLSVAMGNANDHIRAISDVVVSDCDHGGCKEAIEKYLL